MKRLIDFVKMTLIGGLLVVLPIWLAVLLLVKAIKGALLVLKPIAALLPQQVVNDYLVAFALLLAICFVTGLLMSARPVQRLGQWLERHILEHMPGLCAAARDDPATDLQGRGTDVSTGVGRDRGSARAGLHRGEARRRTVHRVCLAQPYTNGGRDLHSAARTRASRGRATGQSDGLHHEMGCRFWPVARRDAAEMTEHLFLIRGRR